MGAVANATSSLLQRQANHHHPDKTVVRRPTWLLGIGAAFISFFLQAGSLSLGSLAAVEPVLALELVLVVVGSGIFFGARLDKRTWLSVWLMTAGTVGLIAALNPQKNEHVTISAAQWAIAIGMSAVAAAACVLGSRVVRHQAYRAALLGVGTGISFGFAAALLKAVMLKLAQHGLLSVFTAWQFYLAVVFGIGSFWILQITLRAGSLVASQPGITLADPLVAICWGAGIYGEKMNGGFAWLLAALMGVILVAGAILLAQSPAVKQEG